MSATQAKTPAEICEMIEKNLERVKDALANGCKNAAWSWFDQVEACAKAAKAMLPEPPKIGVCVCHECGKGYSENLSGCPHCGTPA